MVEVTFMAMRLLLKSWDREGEGEGERERGRERERGCV